MKEKANNQTIENKVEVYFKERKVGIIEASMELLQSKFNIPAECWILGCWGFGFKGFRVLGVLGFRF